MVITTIKISFQHKPQQPPHHGPMHFHSVAVAVPGRLRLGESPSCGPLRPPAGEHSAGGEYAPGATPAGVAAAGRVTSGHEAHAVGRVAVAVGEVVVACGAGGRSGQQESADR